MSSLATGSEQPLIPFQLKWHGDHYLGAFAALGCDCHLLLATADGSLARQLLFSAQTWVEAFEARFSRYRQGSLCDRVIRAEGRAVPIDDQAYRLLKLADSCYRLSNGLFDITSGILRQAWRFDGKFPPPDKAKLEPLLARIGWDRVHVDARSLVVPAGMELDFGGLGKEFAVDSIAQLLRQSAPDVPALVNFGGDIALSLPRPEGWQIGLPNGRALTLCSGALATSGDTQRFIEYRGKRYGHILDPRTGWPVPDGPSQVTVAGPNCTFAGLLSTLAMLQGDKAEDFLKNQQQPYWLWS